jgi:hypothetical protein
LALHVLLPVEKVVLRSDFGCLDAISGDGRLFAEELDPLFPEAGIVLRGFDQVQKALQCVVEPLLQPLGGGCAVWRRIFARHS